MDHRGDLLLILGSGVVLFGGPRWSRTSMDHRGDLLFVLVLVSSGLGPGKSQILGGTGRSVTQVCCRGSAGVGGMGWTPGASP